MKKIWIIISALLTGLMSTTSAQNMVFGDYFRDTTLRLDYFHTGNTTEDIFAPDRILNDGPWPGSKTHLLDELPLGPYFFEVEDAASGRLIFSRGFASIFGEWQSTPEAVNYGTFHESVRFPWPKKPVVVYISKRQSDNTFQRIWQISIDPASRAVNPSPLPPSYEWWEVFCNGKPEHKVDIVVLGDGYSFAQKEKFKGDAERLVGELFKVEPFKSRKTDFNVRALWTPCALEGINKPHPGVFRRTPLSLTYGAFDSERYVLGFDNRTLRDVAATVPYDFTFIIVNERTYGGGGIYNLYATVSADNKFSDYIFVHEFGHHLAALADEYYTSAVAYEAPDTQVEPWEPNITVLKDPANLKWKHLVEEGTPIPTPWDKKEYDSFSYEIQKKRKAIREKGEPEEVMEALFEYERNHEREAIARMKYTGKVGAFEGAGYQQYGLYRAETDCIMFTRNKQAFCRVCQDAIQKVIDQYCR
ncbi:MAG: IgA Peptidase M64 [Bacteroidales bacterium]